MTTNITLPAPKSTLVKKVVIGAGVALGIAAVGVVTYVLTRSDEVAAGE